MYIVNTNTDDPYTLLDIEKFKIIPYPLSDGGFMNRQQLKVLADKGIFKPDFTKGTRRKTSYYSAKRLQEFSLKMGKITHELSKLIPWVSLSPAWKKANNFK